jgi:antitoxin component YwqK of YwqJK toxin-antitoxin module
MYRHELSTVTKRKHDPSKFIKLANTYHIPIVRIEESMSIFSCLIADCGDSNIDNIDIPDKYLDQELGNYVMFLLFHCIRYDLRPISFEFCQYVSDKNYLRYLVCLLLRDWDKHQTMISGLHNDIQRDIYGYCPFHLLPDHLISNKYFFNQWYRDNGNIQFKIGNDIYLTKVSYHENGKIRRLHCFKNSIKHGLDITWYKSGNMSCRQHYQDDELHGLKVSYHLDQKLETHAYYQNGNLHGVKTSWYSSGNPRERVEYQDGKKHGIHITWYDNIDVNNNETNNINIETDNTNINNVEVSIDVININVNNINFGDNTNSNNMCSLYTYVNNKRNGKFKQWYISGRKKVSGTLYNGQIIGLYRDWHLDTDNCRPNWDYVVNFNYIKNKLNIREKHVTD